MTVQQKYGKVDRLWENDTFITGLKGAVQEIFMYLKSVLQSDNIQLLCLHISLKNGMSSPFPNRELLIFNFLTPYLSLSNLTLLMYFCKHIVNHILRYQ